tara:strand:+ start:1921 stop:2748 length:828 start_codon:yes stop_codon:yes gene_type:complete
MKLNLIGEGVRHTSNGHTGKSSTHGKYNRLVEWTENFPAVVESEHTVYIDYAMRHVETDPVSKHKYAWLIESKFITPDVVQSVASQYEAYFTRFKYIFTHNRELLNLDNRFKFVPATGFWIKEAKIYDKTKLVSMISSNKRMCQGHLYRLHWVHRLRDQLDLYGRGFNEIESKEEGLCDYMFSVAIENGSYSTYFTEKILDCFAAGTVPVYFGSPDIGDYFNTDGIIMLDENFDISQLTPELYYSKMDAIKDNLERVKEMETPEDWFCEKYLKNE